MKSLVAALVAVFVTANTATAAVDIQEVTSKGGIKAWLVEEHSIPFVSLEIRFKGGASLDAEGKRGAINLMTALLEEGAGDLSSREFAATRDGLAATMEFDVFDDALSVSAQFLTENRDGALDLLRLALHEPRFDQAAIDRVRGQVLSIIDSDAKDPDAIAGATFDRLVFGDHPYGSDLNGTTESVSALSREDLLAAKGRVITRDRMYVSAVGDITADELGEILDMLFRELPAAGAPLPPSHSYSLDGGLTVVPYETPQSVVIFGQRGIARDDEDFFAGYLMMQVLGGGGFNSRLMEEVREKRGLTYGIGAFLFPRDFSHLIQGNVSSDNSKVAEAIDVIKAEWVRVAEEGLNAEEVNRVKTYLTGAYPLRFDGNSRIARILVGMQMEELGLDYVNTRNAKVDAVTKADIDAIIERLIDPEGLHFVVVGKPVGLTASN